MSHATLRFSSLAKQCHTQKFYIVYIVFYIVIFLFYFDVWSDSYPKNVKLFDCLFWFYSHFMGQNHDKSKTKWSLLISRVEWFSFFQEYLIIHLSEGVCYQNWMSYIFLVLEIERKLLFNCCIKGDPSPKLLSGSRRSKMIRFLWTLTNTRL